MIQGPTDTVALPLVDRALCGALSAGRRPLEQPDVFNQILAASVSRTASAQP